MVPYAAPCGGDHGRGGVELMLGALWPVSGGLLPCPCATTSCSPQEPAYGNLHLGRLESSRPFLDHHPRGCLATLLEGRARVHRCAPLGGCRHDPEPRAPWWGHGRRVCSHGA